MLRTFFRVILLFLIIFNFKLPYIYYSSSLSVILAACYYVYFKNTIPFTFFFKKYNFIIFIGLICTILICAFIAITRNTYEITLVKVFVLQLFMLSCLVFCLPVLIEGKESSSFEEAMKIVVYAFVLQGLIQFLGFTIPAVGSWLISIKEEYIQDFLLNGPFDIYFRGYVLAGQPFFELPAGYGIAFVLLFRILLIDGQKLITGYKIYICLFLLLFGSLLTGRTAFVGLGMGALMCLFIFRKPIKTLISLLQTTILFLLFLFVVFLFMPSQRQTALVNHVFPFAFEMFYQYEETGRLSTHSTDIMLYDHYYEIPEDVMFRGTGRYLKSDGYYGDTDAGYMRTVLYGGVFYLLYLIFYQTLYFYEPLLISKRNKTHQSWADFVCIGTLFLYLFVLELKAEALASQNITEVILLFLGSSFMVRHYDRVEKRRNLVAGLAG